MNPIYAVRVCCRPRPSCREGEDEDVALKKSADYFENSNKETAAMKFNAVCDQSVSRKTLVNNEFNTVNQRYRENQAIIETADFLSARHSRGRRHRPHCRGSSNGESAGR